MLGYTFWHWLFVYSCVSCLFLHTCCYSVIFQLSVYPVIVIFCVQFILLLFCAHCLYAQAVLFTHTLTRSLSDDPGFARPDIGRFVSIVRYSMRPYILWGAWVSLWFGHSHLSYLPIIFLILDISVLVVIPVLDSYDIMRGCLYVTL